MADFTSEDEIRELLKSVYQPAAPSPEFKNQLLQDLIHRGGVTLPLWRQPRLWVPIAASAISAVIGYGIWLGQTIGATLVP